MRKQLNLAKNIENHTEEASALICLAEIIMIVHGVKVIDCIHQNVAKWLVKNSLNNWKIIRRNGGSFNVFCEMVS